MLTEYIEAAMHRATYEVLEDDGKYFGHIPGLHGVWANEKTLEECRDELRSALEDWIVFSLAMEVRFRPSMASCFTPPRLVSAAVRRS